MIAAVVTKKALPCIVLWTGRAGLMSVVTRTYCGDEMSAGDGVLQLPDKTKFCASCVAAVSKAEAAE